MKSAKKLFKRNEKGAGGIAETLIITLFAVLITGAVALLIYNAISDKGNAVTQGIISTGGSAPSDLDGDGVLNGLVLMGQASDKSEYWRLSNPITDFGQPGSATELLTGDDDGDGPTNSAEANAMASTTQDSYYKKLGATLKSVSTAVGVGDDPQDPTN